MNEYKTKVLIALFFSVLSLICFYSLWLPKGTTLTYEVDCSKKQGLEVFYADAHEPFNSKKRLRHNVAKGKSHVTFFIPGDRLQRLRIDCGNNPGVISFSNIQVRSRDGVSFLNDHTVFTPIHIESIRSDKSSIIVQSKHADPLLIVKEVLNLRGERTSIDWYYLLLLSFVPFYLVFVISDLCCKKNINTDSSQGKLMNLDFLRILFTFGVLDHHFAELVLQRHGTGMQGVEFFFILSGYFLLLTYRPNRSIAGYAASRYIRFVPLVILGSMLSGGGWKSFLGVFMLQNTGVAYIDVPNAPAWYIAVLFWVSLFYMGIIKTVSYRKMLVFVGTLTFLTLIFVANIKGHDRWFTMEAIPLHRGLLRGVSCMGLGILLAHICNPRYFRQDSKLSIVCSLSEIGVLVYLITGFFNPDVPSDYWIFQPITHVMLIALFVIRRGVISRLTSRPIFSKLSTYCLAIYLTHWFFFTTARAYALKQHPGWIESNGILCLWIAFAGSCLLGVLAHHLVEKPCTRYLNNWLMRFKEDTLVSR